MNDGRPLVGIDIGSSTVSVVVATPEDDHLVIHGCGRASHDGAKRGVIANLDEVSESILAAADEAETMASVPVERAAVGIGGLPIQGNPSTASVPVTGRNNTVSRDDVARALQACAKRSIPEDFQVLDIIPGGFALDGQPGMDHPEGMPGRRLDASAYVLYCNVTHMETVLQAVNHASVQVSHLYYEPLAAAEAVLTRDERELGCLLLDIGHATTEWLLFSEGVVIASGAVAVGGRHFTTDLATMLKTTSAAAEETKRMVGVQSSRVETQAVEVPSLGGDGNQVHRASFAAEVLYERGRELFVTIHRSLAKDRLDQVPRAGVVLTGGGARLEGLEGLAETIFSHHTRVGLPRQLTGVVDPVSGPDWAVACGLVRLVARREERFAGQRDHRGGILAKIRHALEDFFELGGGQ